MHMAASTVYYIIGAVVVGGGAAIGVIRFFLDMNSTVKTTAGNVETIMTNHLPHIYSSIGELKGEINARKD